MVANIAEKIDYEALINEYGVLPYLGNVGKGYAIQQRPEELSAFIEFCVQHNVQTVLELGGADGGLSCFMAEALGWKVTSVDIVPPKRRHENVEFIQMTTDAAYQFLQGRAFDLVFIDADHAYESVKSDHERYAHLGKIVAFHDINSGRDCCEGVVKYWGEFIQSYTKGEILWHAAIANDGKDAPGIGWYCNPDFNPGLTRWELYSEPLPDAVPDICVVSGTCDRLPYLTKMIESARASIPYGVTLHFVIVDGGSTDGTLEYLRQQPDVTLIEHGEKRGIAAAYRDGFDAARGKYVVTANDDIEFVGMCLWNALTHLEQTPTAGGVAFYFDNPGRPDFYHVQSQGFKRDGATDYTAYAQVGMFRYWVGQAAGWWGGHDPEFPARNYGLDNYLTSRVFEMGYTVDAVKECQFHDRLVQDALRQGNAHDTLRSGQHPDSDIWRNRFNGGFPVWNSTPVPAQETQHLRILYTPILAGKTEDERRQLCGWLNSFQKVGIVAQYDYLGAARQGRNIGAELVALIKEFRPHIWFSQIQSADVLTPAIYYKARAAHTSMVAVNWNGDEMRDIWNNRALVDIMRSADLQLTVNPSLFAGAVQHGVNMALMLDSFQPVEPDSDAPEFDVVFLGSNYAPRHTPGKFPRKEMIDAIRQRLPHVKLGVFGHSWGGGVEENTYDFGRNHGIYAKAKLAIVDNMYPDDWGYVSDRFYNALAYSQCCLVQEVDGAFALFGVHNAHHLVYWDDFDRLCSTIETLLKKPDFCETVGHIGREHIHKHHTFDARTRELLDIIPALVKKK